MRIIIASQLPSQVFQLSLILLSNFTFLIVKLCLEALYVINTG